MLGSFDKSSDEETSCDEDSVWIRKKKLAGEKDGGKQITTNI